MEAGRQATSGRVARNTTVLTVALVGQKFLSFLYVLILVRLIGVSSAGDYYSSLSFIGLFSVFIDLGLTQAFIRQTARDEQQGIRDLRMIVAIKLLTAVVVAAVMIGMVVFLQRIGRFSTDILYLNIAAGIMILDSFVITFYGFLRGIEHLEYESLGIIIHRVTIMIIGITSLSLGAPHIWSMVALGTGSVANLSFVLFQLWKRRVTWRPLWQWSDIRRLLRIAAPFAVAAFFIAIYSSSDNILLQMFGGRRPVGLYGTASKIIAAFTQIFPSALVAAVFPAMSASFVSDREKLRSIFQNAMTYLMVVAIPLMVVVFFLARPIMLAGWGEVWADAIWPLRVLALGMPFLFLNYPVGYLLNATNRQTQNTINVAIVVITNIGANLLFVRSYTFHSVAIISVISSALLFFLGLWRVRSVISMPSKELATVLMKTLVTGAFVACIGWALLPTIHQTIGALAVAAVMGTVYILAMFAFRLIRWEQISAILRKFRRA